MIVEKLSLTHFRNYASFSADFSPKVNIFIGENAQGKTNVIEAIYALALTRSHRSRQDKEMIKWDQDFARIEARIKNARDSFPMEITFSKQGKMAKLNHLEQKRISSYIGHLNVIIFAPEDLEIVKGSPSVRRRFIDMELGQMSPLYLHHLSEYNHILKQRNQYLKMMGRSGTKADPIYFDILTEQLALEGAHVLSLRYWFIDRLLQWSKTIHKGISNDKEDLDIRYSSTTKLDAVDDMNDVDKIFTHYKDQLDRTKEKDIEQGVTSFGPHRDDMIFYINDRNVQSFASQGQQRTTALSIKLAEIDLMHEVKGEYPVLLLDDVLSELDQDRQTHLLTAIQDKVQTFLTTTSVDGIQANLIKNPKIFMIHDGQIETE